MKINSEINFYSKTIDLVSTCKNMIWPWRFQRLIFVEFEQKYPVKKKFWFYIIILKNCTLVINYILKETITIFIAKATWNPQKTQCYIVTEEIVWRFQSGNQKPLMEGQTIQWHKKDKRRQWSTRQSHQITVEQIKSELYFFIFFYKVIPERHKLDIDLRF